MAEVEEIRGCVIRKDLYYAVDDHTWVRLNDDGTATVGMTDVAQNLAGPILHVRVKKVGTVRAKGKPLGTVESSKWVGPIKSPISGEIVEINEALKEDPQLVNRSPYNRGWVARLQPSNLEEELKDLLSGDQAVAAYQEKIEREDIKACEHLEGFEI
ncbi:MAG: glycine cleavage system protein GcvH [Calditrichaeota bacterium]|nr:MAG: glycine cleavage system protein GcvH [Calditrichota bacterium]